MENPSIESPMINEATKEKGNDGAKAKTNEEISEKEEDVKGGDAVNSKDNGEDGLKSVIKFLKERIPGFKVQVLDVSVPEEIKVETEIVEQLAQENDEKADSSEDSADETADLENDQQEEETLPVDEASEEAGKDSKLKLFIGGVLHNKEDVSLKAYARVPAEMKSMEKDSFVLHISGRNSNADTGEAKAAKIKVAAIAAQVASDLMPSEVAKAFWSTSKATSKVRTVCGHNMYILENFSIYTLTKFSINTKTSLAYSYEVVSCIYSILLTNVPLFESFTDSDPTTVHGLDSLPNFRYTISRGHVKIQIVTLQKHISYSPQIQCVQRPCRIGYFTSFNQFFFLTNRRITHIQHLETY